MFRLRTLGPVELEGASGPQADAVTRAPKRLALLVYLAVDSPRGFKRRDALAALLWPELDQQRARHALRNTLHELRKALDDGVLCSRGSEEVGLSTGGLWCDLVAFDEMLAAGQHEEALALYRGPFLDSFHVPGVSPEFEQWVNRERDRLTDRHAATLESLAESCEVSDDFRAAAEHWRVLSVHRPWDGRVVLRLMLALEAAGDRAQAIRRADAYTVLVREELEADPDQEVTALAARLREVSVDAKGREEISRVAALPRNASAAVPAATRRAGRSTPMPPTRRVRGAVTTLLIAVVAVGGLLWRQPIKPQVGRNHQAHENVPVRMTDELPPQNRARLTEGRAVDPKAFELYTKGAQARYRTTGPQDLAKAANYFKGAIVQDSTYAPAYAGLAFLYATTGDEARARQFADKALALDPTLPEAHMVLGMVRHFSDWDWVGSEAAFREAIRLNPGYAEAHHELSMLLMRRQRFDEALLEAQRALYLAPMSARFEIGAGEVYLYSGRYNEALEATDDALAVDSINAGSYMMRAYAYAEQQRYDKAAEAARKCIALGWDVHGRAILGYVYAKSGRRAEAVKLVDTLTAKWRERNGERAVSNVAIGIAAIYAGLGDRGRALDWLERAVGTGMYVAYLGIDPTFRSLHAEPRFRTLLKTVGLEN
jgi:DNA-binding SARP family transcriptional activator/cytochrome c-type biogenesis protein CcmH/NrfG